MSVIKILYISGRFNLPEEHCNVYFKSYMLKAGSIQTLDLMLTKLLIKNSNRCKRLVLIEALIICIGWNLASVRTDLQIHEINRMVNLISAGVLNYQKNIFCKNLTFLRNVIRFFKYVWSWRKKHATSMRWLW